MNRKLITSLVGASLLGVSTLALADVTVGGRVHISSDHVENDSTSSVDGNEQSFVSSNFSYLLIKASEDLGGGLKAIAQVKPAFRTDDGSGGLGGTLYDTFAGISGGFGAVTAGRIDSPAKNITGIFNKLGTRVGDSRNVSGQGGGSWDQRHSNAVRYDSPKFGGVTFAAQHASDENTTSGDRTAANVRFSGGPVSVGVAYEQHSTATEDEESIIRATGAYKIGPATIVALYETMSDLGGTAGADRDTFGAGGSFSFGSFVVGGHYVKADAIDDSATDNGGTLLAVYGDYKLSKKAKLYVVYSEVDNDDGASFKASGAGAHSNSLAVVAGQDQSAISAGLQIDF